ncbi:PARP-domain-containing protein [Gonapodya prolifera JEL478]|uniref:Poly [ADP-ribose] polymerase n=1 Tax=Gonapodya prolifera (strain JEL478) TaxID=1344416 RepID=A0A139ABB6_GONPJ|nr:PARP-domain-containing protein [Gonapodya prolifera JEL478]|eukprot:KXS13693.1 PARP-domain-containing protein [Gonapodya prolifera JEL478]
MPPRRSGRKGAATSADADDGAKAVDGKAEAAAGTAEFFSGVVFAFNPTVDKTPDAKHLREVVEDNGGKVQATVTKKVDFFVALSEDAAKPSAKFKSAQSSGLPIVTPDFILACGKAGSKVDSNSYLVGAAKSDDDKDKDTTDGMAVDDKVDDSSKDAPDAIAADPKPEKGKGKKRKEPEPDDTPAEPPKMVKAIRKGRAPVDRFCGVASQSHVYEAPDGTLYDAMLNQTNISANNNKFYVIQVLEGDTGKGYWTWNRWGRVGETGQSGLKSFGSAAQAISDFEKKFRDKTSNAWANRESFNKVGGKYDLVQVDYGADDGEDDEQKQKKEQEKKVAKAKAEATPSKLGSRVQNLVKLIFNLDMMEREMASLEYDSRKMPLGKLSKAQMRKGYQVLQRISEELGKTGSVNQRKVMDMSSEFYTIIPHDFGRRMPPSINTPSLLKTKLSMLEALADIEIATELMKSADEEGNENPVDAQFAKLGCDVEEVPKGGDVWQMIDKLLWHGSRLTNFVGILSQGLRIAPPEAPVTGYMFGKGVYFADAVSKSANYCFASRTNPTGLLLLCEVALGDQFELLQSDYYADQHSKEKNKHSTKGMGQFAPDDGEKIVHENMDVPLGKLKKTSDGKAGSLLYNEYIVYDTKQIRIRYIIRVKFNYKQGTFW